MTAFWRMICAELLALAALYAPAFSFQTRSQLMGNRAPTESKLLCPRSESLDRPLAELDEKAILTIVLVVLLGMLASPVPASCAEGKPPARTWTKSTAGSSLARGRTTTRVSEP